MLSQSVTEDIVLICAALQPIITALFWFFQCMGIQAKTLRLQAVRCLLFTLLHLGLYTGATLCLAEVFPVDSVGSLAALRFAVSLSCMLGLLWNSFTGETRHVRSAADKAVNRGLSGQKSFTKERTYYVSYFRPFSGHPLRI